MNGIISYVCICLVFYERLIMIMNVLIISFRLKYLIDDRQVFEDLLPGEASKKERIFNQFQLFALFCLIKSSKL